MPDRSLRPLALSAALACLMTSVPAWAAQPDDGKAAPKAEKDEPTAAPDGKGKGEPAAADPAPEAKPAPAPELEPAPEPTPAPAPKPAATPAPETPPAPKPAAAPAGEPAKDDNWRSKMHLSAGPIHLSPVILLATQLSPYAGEESFFQSGDIAERPGFRLRNARLGFDAGFRKVARARVATEIGSGDRGDVRISSAWAAFTPYKQIGVYAGAQAVPFSRNALLRTGRLALIERPLAARAMAPGQQIGVAARGEVADGAFAYSAGVFNGLQRSADFYGGFAENYAPWGNRFDGLAYAVRVTTEPLERLRPTAADERQGAAALGIGGGYFFSDGGVRDLHSAGLDAHLQVSGFHLLAEGLWSLSMPEEVPTQPIDTVQEVMSYSVSAELGYQIVADMLGLAARFELIDPNTDSEDESDNWLITAGARFMFVDGLLRLNAEYTHREEMFGVAIANDSATLQLQLQLDPARYEGNPW